MLNEQSMIDIFKNSLPVTTLELLGSNIYPQEMQKEVKTQPLSLQSEKQVLTQDYQDNTYGLIIDLVRAGIQSAIDFDNLYLFDIEYLFNAIRISTHGSHLSVSTKCPSCGNTNNTNVDLSVININKPNTLDDISSKATINNVDFIIRYPTVKHYEDTIKIMNNVQFPDSVRQFIKNNNLANDKQIKQIDDQTVKDLNTVVSYIYSMQGQEIKTKEEMVFLCQFLLLLPENSLLEFVPKIQNIMKPFELKPEIVCSSCKTHYNIDIVDLGVDYFFPRRT